MPVPVCGLALGIATLDRFFHPTYDFYKYNVGAAIALILIVLFTIRVIIDRRGVARDLEHPAMFGVLPTYTMTIMVLAAIAKDHLGNAVIVIWYAAIIASFVMIFFFIRKFVLRFELRNVFPSWTVMFTGFLVASTTSPVFGMEELGRILFWIGFIAYLTVLPPILYRLMKIRLPEGLVPTIAILAGPVNLCIVGGIRSYGYAPPVIPMTILTVMGIVSFLAVLAYMPVMLNRRFYPTFAAFTFPLVISAISIYELGKLHGLPSDGVFLIVQETMFAIAALSVLHVLIRYMIYFYRTAREAGVLPDHYHDVHFRQAPPDPE
jgi:exfoliative toxin A/B